MDNNHYNAAWWGAEHDSGWERIKAAFRRDWEQTKHDLGGKQPDLKQHVPDTIQQAAGETTIPPGNAPVGGADFEEVEAAFRFGYGARLYYGKIHVLWDAELERKLQNDWSQGGDAAQWQRYSSAVRRGYEYKGPGLTQIHNI